MSFRKRTLTKPNIGASRKKTGSEQPNTDSNQDIKAKLETGIMKHILATV